jgi:hypothetical protein
LHALRPQQGRHDADICWPAISTARKRPDLTELIEDIPSGRADFDHVPVYDVSRWGCFEDIDESASGPATPVGSLLVEPTRLKKRLSSRLILWDQKRYRLSAIATPSSSMTNDGFWSGASSTALHQPNASSPRATPQHVRRMF